MEPKSHARYFFDCFFGYLASFITPRFWSLRHTTLLVMAVLLVNQFNGLMRQALHWSMAPADSSIVTIWLLNFVTALLLMLAGILLVSAVCAAAALRYRLRASKNNR